MLIPHSVDISANIPSKSCHSPSRATELARIGAQETKRVFACCLTFPEVPSRQVELAAAPRCLQQALGDRGASVLALSAESRTRVGPRGSQRARHGQKLRPEAPATAVMFKAPQLDNPAPAR